MKRYIQRSLDIDYDKASYPLLAMPKYNGVFIYNSSDRPLTREGNIISNVHIREKFKKYFELLDTLGVSLEHEIIIPGKTFNYTSGVVRSDDNPEGGRTVLVIVDKYIKGTGFKYRYAQAKKIHDTYCAQFPDVWMCPFELVSCERQARGFTQRMIALKDPTIEGAVFRSAFSFYKEGRSTLAEGCFLRDKEIATIDARIEAIHESISLEGIPKGMAHSVTVRLDDGSTTDVSMTNNLTDDERRHIFQNPQLYIGRYIQYLTNPCAGMENRHTRFDCWRPDKDEDKSDALLSNTN